jgi:hypothetical protein
LEHFLGDERKHVLQVRETVERHAPGGADHEEGNRRFPLVIYHHLDAEGDLPGLGVGRHRVEVDFH